MTKCDDYNVKELVATLKDIFKNMNGLIAAGIVGSIAKGRYYGPESDLDLFFVVESNSALKSELPKRLKSRKFNNILKDFYQVDVFVERVLTIDAIREKLDEIKDEREILRYRITPFVEYSINNIELMPCEGLYWRILKTIKPFVNKGYFAKDLTRANNVPLVRDTEQRIDTLFEIRHIPPVYLTGGTTWWNV